MKLLVVIYKITPGGVQTFCYIDEDIQSKIMVYYGKQNCGE